MADLSRPPADIPRPDSFSPPVRAAPRNGRANSYRISLTWTGNQGSGTSSYKHYSRDHELQASGKPPIHCSSDPIFRGDPTRYNPEELLVSSLSACHMLWYLHLCADAGIVVTDYRDDAVGELVEMAGDGGRFREVVLAPHVRIAAGGDLVLAESLHRRAHDLCFVANSVNFPVRCVSEIAFDDR
jgi:organic hydroperoxide reductase OsmC/OhrA